MLIVNNLTFSFNAQAVLNQLSLSLPTGEIGTLIGISGSGKTTFFRLLTGMLSPQSGYISIAGHTQPEATCHTAYMMQEDLLLPWHTIINNLILPGQLGHNPLPRKSLLEEARLYLHEVGLSAWENAYPEQLSGGMRQRVSLARALLQKKMLLLLDEPFASLDVKLREEMHALLHRVRNRYATTILLITHDFRDALSLSDRIFLLSDGKISQEWPISLTMRQNPLTIHQLNASLKFAITHS